MHSFFNSRSNLFYCLLFHTDILCCYSLYRVNTLTKSWPTLMHLENESVPPLYFLPANFLHFFATLSASRAGDFVNFYDDAIFKHDKKVTSYNKY
jgi:hypothetical protein